MGPFAGQPVCGIEIGVYEGRSTCWLFENILTHPKSRLICIDPFAAFDGITESYRARFIENTEPHCEKIILLTGTSQQELPQLHDFGKIDFVIVDGSHKASDVLFDAVVGWNLLRRGGVMIFDDYAWTGQGHEICNEQDKPRIALDAFVNICAPEVLHKGYQLIILKP